MRSLPGLRASRSAASAKLVVPHESVSRQHAAIFHANQGVDGTPSVHVVDLASAKGTYLDLGTGWTRLPAHSPQVLPPGGRVRLGECPTRIVYPMPKTQAAPPNMIGPPASTTVDDGDDAVGSASSAAPDAVPIGPTAMPPKTETQAVVDDSTSTSGDLPSEAAQARRDWRTYRLRNLRVAM